MYFVDTEGSFMVERALQIAEACLEDMREYHGFLKRDLQACQVNMHPKDFLENIFYFRVCSYTEQIAVVNYLEKFISEHKDVGRVTLLFKYSSSLPSHLKFLNFMLNRLRLL